MATVKIVNLPIWGFLYMGDPQVTSGFNTKMVINGLILDDLEYCGKPNDKPSPFHHHFSVWHVYHPIKCT